MKLLGVAPLLVLLSFPGVGEQRLEPVNAVIGDVSYLAAHGVLPSAGTTEQDRLTTHLRYVHERLQSSTPHDLPPHLAEARALNLRRLNEYISLGRFPVNEVCPHRRVPVFVDAVGTRCAVAYLLEQDLGTEAVLDMASQYRYALLPDIDSPALDGWQASSGLSARELAMIQPAYGANANCRLNATTTPCPLFVCPQGDTDSFAEQGWSIDLWVYDVNWNPIPGIPAGDIWLIDCDPAQDAELCGGAASSNADANTDANGKATMSQGTLSGGGCADGMAVVVQGFVLLDSLTNYTTVKCLSIGLRSPDIDGNLDVNLVDLSLFATSFPPGTQDTCCDMNLDGTVNLSDLSLWAYHFGPPGHICL